VVCYYGSWAVYRPGDGKFDVEDIDPFVCTHLIFGFAGLKEYDNSIYALDPYNELYENWGRGKILLSYEHQTWHRLIKPNIFWCYLVFQNINDSYFQSRDVHWEKEIGPEPP
jgi:hypothetical protein